MTAALNDWRTAPVDAKVRAALCFLEKLTLEPGRIGPGDVEPLRAAGVSDEAIEDLIHICALFNLLDRVADALGFVVPSVESFRRGASLLLKHGYAT